MDKKRFRKEVFNSMVYFAENFHDNSYSVYPWNSFKEIKEFKPTLSDKLIFSNILDKVLENLWEDYKNNPHPNNLSTDHLGFQVLCHHYSLEYGWWDDKEFKEASS